MLTHEQTDLLAQFKTLVLESNKKFNLTTITSDEDFAVKHIADSLSLLPWLPDAPTEKPLSKRNQITLLDIGTGAGFPGVPLAIARPDLRVVLIDSTRKKIDFVASALDKLGIPAECLHLRVEALSRTMHGIEFDVVVARAVAELPKLAGWALPLVTPGGRLLAMKGPDPDREIKDAAPLLKKYRATVEEVAPVELAPGMTHTVVVIRKD